MMRIIWPFLVAASLVACEAEPRRATTQSALTGDDKIAYLYPCDELMRDEQLLATTYPEPARAQAICITYAELAKMLHPNDPTTTEEANDAFEDFMLLSVAQAQDLAEARGTAVP